MNFTDNAVIFRENVQDMEESEIIKYLLQFTQRAANKETIAAALLEQFGNLKNVLEARPEQLRAVPGIGPKTASLIASFLPMVKIWQRVNMTAPASIRNAREAELYCKSLLSGLRNEEFWVICLNAKCDVIGKRRISSGSLSEVSAYPRLVAETALNYNAHSVLLSHNHPGGTCAPSPEDISSTLQLQRLLGGLGILVLDHVIVAKDFTYIMIGHGDIDYIVRNQR